jgi:hypothetical protein
MAQRVHFAIFGPLHGSEPRYMNRIWMQASSQSCRLMTNFALLHDFSGRKEWTIQLWA